MIVFLHIHKTAGTTVNYIIYRNFSTEKELHLFTGGEHFLHNFSYRYYEEKIKEYLRNCDLPDIVFGHFNFGIHTYFKETDIKYFSFVRNPKRQYLSMFNHTLSDKNLEAFNANSYRDIESFLILKITHNLQTFLLSGIADPDEFNADLNRSLEIAKANIEKYFPVVGISERFDESLLLLSRTIGLRRIYYKKQNVRNSKKLVFNADVMQSISDSTKLDLQIYNYVVARFNMQIKEVPFFKLKLFKFRVFNYLHKLGIVN